MRAATLVLECKGVAAADIRYVIVQVNCDCDLSNLRVAHRLDVLDQSSVSK